MNRLFWGLLFCFVDVDLTLGTAVFELLPDFVGCFLLMKGMEALSGESRFFDRGRHMAFGLMIIQGILYAADLMNPEMTVRVLFWALELAALTAMLVLLRWVVFGTAEMLKNRNAGDNGEQLRTVWLVLAVVSPICHLLGWVPLVGTVCAVASAVTGICFLAALYGAKKRLGNRETK